MNSVLIICDKYYPLPSSNGACVSNLVKVLSKKKKVVVITFYDDVSNKIGYNGESIYSLGISATKSSFLNKAFSCQQDADVINRVDKLIQGLVCEYDFEYIIGVYRPIEAIFCGLNAYKTYNIPFFPLFLDIVGLEFSSTIKRKIAEINYARLYNRLAKKTNILILENYQNHFVKKLNNSSKLTCVGVPNLIESKSEFRPKLERKYLKIVYTGSFYKKIRNPKKVLECLKFIVGSNLQIHLYSWGCEETIAEYKEIYKNNLIIHSRKESREIQDILYDADFLLNVSNDCEMQIPGKTYEYFATGKPIINCKFRENDIGDSDYNKYPLIYTINVNEQISEERFFEFVEKNKNKQIEFKEVKELYYKNAPEYIVEKIESWL